MPYKDPEKANAKRRERYYANLEHERQRGRDYYVANREARLVSMRAWREANPQKHRDAVRAWQENNPEKVRGYAREKEAKRAMARHGGPDEYARMMADQDGQCYLCGRAFAPGDDIHVDHDHACCPGTKANIASCRACRRGLAHAACNQIIGLCGENMDLLRAIAANFEPVREAAAARVAAAKALQPALL